MAMIVENTNFISQHSFRLADTYVKVIVALTSGVILLLIFIVQVFSFSIRQPTANPCISMPDVPWIFTIRGYGNLS